MSATSFLNPGSRGGTTGSSGFPQIPTRISTGALPDSEVNEIPEVIERLVKLEAELAAVHRICSEAYCTQGRYGDALDHQAMAAKLDSEDVEYRNQLGWLRYLEGDDGALEDFEWVIQRQNTNAEAYFNLGMVYFGQSRLAEAERNFALAAQFSPSDAETWNNLGVARFQLGRVAEAKSCFERSLQVDPGYDDARQNLEDCATT